MFNLTFSLNTIYKFKATTPIHYSLNSTVQPHFQTKNYLFYFRNTFCLFINIFIDFVFLYIFLFSV